jgi:methylated-DNA-[protein]-cysteine S-methyltransferase
MSTTSFPSSFGRCGIAWSESVLTSFHLPGDRAIIADSGDVAPDWVMAVIVRVQRHLEGDMQDFSDLPFDFSSVTSFQQAVFAAALTVKAGETRSYGWLAEKLGRGPSASRAIGTALGRNPWPLLVPCHRFVGANGKLTGYSGPGGIATKQRLLALELGELPIAYAPL